MLDELAVASVMTTRVVTVQPATPLRELVATMTEARLHAVPVVDRYDQPIGVVSWADLPPQDERAGRGKSVAELMTTPVRAVHADEPLSFVARLLAKAGLRRLFVVNWDSRLVGVVARRDLLRVFLRDDDELHTQIVDLLRAADITPGAIDVRVDAGLVTVCGAVTRRGLAEMIVRMIRALPGVVDLRDNLSYLVDDLVDDLVGGTPGAGSMMAQRGNAAGPGVRFPLSAARARSGYRGGALERGGGSATLVPGQRRP